MKRRKRREWAQDELEFIRNNWDQMQLAEIARRLDRPVSSVAKKAAEMGLRKSRPWTIGEEAFLRQNYGQRPARELARELGRSLKAVFQRAYELGLCRETADSKRDLSLIEKLRLEEGDRVQICQRYGKGRTVSVSEGTVVKVYKDHVLVQLERWRESFNLGQIACGEVQIIRLGRRQATCA